MEGKNFFFSVASQNETNRTRLILTLGVLFVTSSSFIFIAANKDPYAIAFVRVFVTGSIAFFILRPYDSNTSPIVFSDARNIVIAGISLATHFGWWFNSLDIIDIGISLSLTNTAPIWLAFLSFVILGHSPSHRQVISIIFVITGSIILFLASPTITGNEWKGLVLALASAIGFAIYLLSAKQTVPKLGLWRYFGLVNFVSALTLYLWVILRNDGNLLFDPFLWFWGVLLALFPGISGHAVYNWAMAKLDAVDVGIATLGEPVLGTFLAWILLDQTLSRFEILGYLFLILAIGFTIELNSNHNWEQLEGEL